MWFDWTTTLRLRCMTFGCRFAGMARETVNGSKVRLMVIVTSHDVIAMISARQMAHIAGVMVTFEYGTTNGTPVMRQALLAVAGCPAQPARSPGA